MMVKPNSGNVRTMPPDTSSIDPVYLLTFARVADEGNLSRAAASMTLTQPAMSNRMGRLSSAVGEPLFTRHRLGVRLTPAGFGLLEHARAVARALEGARGFAAGLSGLEVGTARIAASTTIASYLLPAVLARYRRAHPGLVVEQFVGNTGEVLGRLAAGGADVALIEGPAGRLPPGIELEVFQRDEIVLVTLPDHPLAAGNGPREPAELEGLEVVWREEGSGTREVAERALTGVHLSPVLELVGSEAVKEAVAEGLGASFLSRLVVEREARAGFLAATRVNAPALSRPLSMLRPPDELLPRAVRVFIEALRA
jgi:DNA-binding transcriptional LysR family regulator